MTEKAERLQQIESAFELFSQASDHLSTSYQQLESQVKHLHRELAVARKERHKESTEGQRLANRLERLLEMLPGGVVVLDEMGRVQDCNRAARELLSEPLRGERWREVIVRAFAPRFDDGHEVSLKDGRRISISTSSLGSEPGQILLLKDVTETRALQDKLSQHQRLSAMGRMAASLAHQVRTPTASALLYTSHLCSGEVDSATRRRYSKKILQQLRHIESMVSNMLLYARGESDGAEDEIFSASDLLSGVNSLLQAPLKSLGGELCFNDELSGVTLHGHCAALVGAISNLILNALQADSGSASVSVRFAKTAQGEVEISVADSGPGIAQTLQQRIFEPFVTTRPQGTGLGLAVVQSVVRHHNGLLQLQSKPGEGATFTLTLPIIAQQRAKQKIEGEVEQ